MQLKLNRAQIIQIIILTIKMSHHNFQCSRSIRIFREVNFNLCKHMKPE